MLQTHTKKRGIGLMNFRKTRASEDTSRDRLLDQTYDTQTATFDLYLSYLEVDYIDKPSRIIMI